MAEECKYRLGDLLIVTGDKGNAEHCFETGTEVKVYETTWWEGGGELDGWGYQCDCTDPECDDTWWVHEIDLKSALPPVTPDEEAAAIASILQGGQ
jgi:hypothetical protein